MATITVASPSAHPQSLSTSRLAPAPDWNSSKPRSFGGRALRMQTVHYTAAEVGLLSLVANAVSNDFARSIGLCNRRFASRYLEHYRWVGAVDIPRQILRYFDLESDGNGEYLWQPLTTARRSREVM